MRSPPFSPYAVPIHFTVILAHDRNTVTKFDENANDLPTLFDICTIEKDVDKANEYWMKVMPFIDYFITYSNNDPHWHEVFKYVLAAQVFDAGLPRRPLGALDDAEKKKIDVLLGNMGDIL